MNSEISTNGAIKIGSLIENDNLNFCIPTIQRNYKWPAKEAVRLMKDVIEYAMERRKNDCKSKSVGLITLSKQGKDDKLCYYVIDGQQRFITLFLIISLLKIDDIKLARLTFERDISNTIRSDFIFKGSTNENDDSIDIYRMKRNLNAMKKQLAETRKNISDKEIFDAIMELICLCNITQNDNQQEFLNINAYKTKFSICDHVRSHLISFYELYREDLKNNIDLISCLLKRESNAEKDLTYKQAVSKLYDDILELLYKGTYGNKSETIFNEIKGVYDTLKNPTKLDPEKTNESRFNILFEDRLSNNAKSYRETDSFNAMFSDGNSYIETLEYVSYCYELIIQLDNEFERGDIPSARSIVSMKRNMGFFALASNLIHERIKLYGANISPTLLHELLASMNRINNVIHDINYKSISDFKAANTFLEAYCHSEVSKKIPDLTQSSEWNLCLPNSISRRAIISAGQYIITRFNAESTAFENSQLNIPPLLKFRPDDTYRFSDNDKLVTKEGREDGRMSAKMLFSFDIVIPVIQRDYCMGSLFNKGETNFYNYIFENLENSDGDIDAGCIIAGVDNENRVHIFDGQQRTYTIYKILESLGYKCNAYIFEGRSGESPYSKRSVDNLNNLLIEKLEENSMNREDILNELLNKVVFTVKTVSEISSAEQFFMDINDGVHLEKYEIFKSALFDRISKLGDLKTDIIDYIENQALLTMYKLAKDTIKDDDGGESIARCAEESEMMLIEHIMRRVWHTKPDNAISDIKLTSYYIKNQNRFCLTSSENEVVSAAGFIKHLDDDEFRDGLNVFIMFIRLVKKYLSDKKKAVKPIWLIEYTNRSKSKQNESEDVIQWNQSDLFFTLSEKEIVENKGWQCYSVVHAIKFLIYYSQKYINDTNCSKRINDLDSDHYLNLLIDLQSPVIRCKKSQQSEIEVGKEIIRKESVLNRLKHNVSVYFYRGYRNDFSFKRDNGDCDNIELTPDTVLFPAYYSDNFDSKIDLIGAHLISESIFSDCQNYPAVVFTLMKKGKDKKPLTIKKCACVKMIRYHKGDDSSILDKAFVDKSCLSDASKLYLFRYTDTNDNISRFYRLTNRINAYKIS